MAEKVSKEVKAREKNKAKWGSTGGAVVPVDLKKVKLVNKPKGK